MSNEMEKEIEGLRCLVRRDCRTDYESFSYESPGGKQFNKLLEMHLALHKRLEAIETAGPDPRVENLIRDHTVFGPCKSAGPGEPKRITTKEEAAELLKGIRAFLPKESDGK